MYKGPDNDQVTQQELNRITKAGRRKLRLTKIFMEKQILERGLNINRRRFLSRLSLGIGSVALGSLLIPDLFSKGEEELAMTGLPHFAPRAKRIIYLFQNGAPSQLDLFDYKPMLQKMQTRFTSKCANGSALNRDDVGSKEISPCRNRLSIR